VLVVEDNDEIRALIAQVLEDTGYAVLTAGDGAEALEILEVGRQPDLILLDMCMPVMDGWVFARAHRDRGGRAPIVVVTPEWNAAKWAGEIDAAGVLTKPFALDDLSAVVAQVCTAFR
jgi:CheY-like chemotaxis protein